MMPTPMEATLIRSLAAFRPILGNIHDAASSPPPRFSSVRRSIPFFSPLPIVVSLLSDQWRALVRLGLRMAKTALHTMGNANYSDAVSRLSRVGDISETTAVDAQGRPIQLGGRVAACVNRGHFKQEAAQATRLIRALGADGVLAVGWSGLDRTRICHSPDCARDFRAS